MRVLDVFCGVGGLSWGFEEVGWNVVAGLDSWEKAIKVFKNAHPNANVLTKDVTKLSNQELLRSVGSVDIVVGGPPCQAFSTVGKRALNDPRAFLVKEFVRIVKVFRPEVFVFENVKGFTSFSKGLLLYELLEELTKLGYNLDFDVLNAANFSAPQVRERFIVVGSLSKNVTLPRGNYVKRGSFWTFEEMTSDLPEVRAGEEAKRYASPPKNELQKFYRWKEPEELTLHYAPNYSKKLIEMMKYLKEGTSAHDVIDQIPPQYRPTSGYKNTYKRIKSNEPTPTITRNFSVPSSSNCIHPKQNRALTPREAARAQTFTDDFPFEGNKQAVRLMIGNAVPPLLSLGLALRIKSYYEKPPLEQYQRKPWYELLSVKKLVNPPNEEELWRTNSTTKKKLSNFSAPLLTGF